MNVNVSHQSNACVSGKFLDMVACAYQALNLVIISRSDICTKVLDIVLTDAVQLVVCAVVLGGLMGITGGKSEEAYLKGVKR